MTSKVTTSGNQFIPNRKVSVGVIAGALTVMLVWALNTYVVSDHPIPAEIASSITTVVTFVLSYLVPEA